jgi:DNA-binding GntR family transcriptional regulator
MEHSTITPDPRIYVRIADDLRQKIRDGVIKSSAPVSITYLSQEWGASRQTVAKALRVLARDGLLCRYPGVGYYVSARTQPAPATTQPGENR